MLEGIIATIATSPAGATGDIGRLEPLLLAGVPTVAALIAAVIAAQSAARVKRLEADAERVRDLENRIAQRKYETYQPIIDLLRRMIDPIEAQVVASDQDAFRQKMSEFSAWAAIFASDDALKLFQRFMQSTYYDAPPVVIMRLYAEFVLAARRDMGYPETSVQAEHLLGIRLKDIYEGPWISAMRIPLPDLYRRENWSPPWTRA